MIAAQKQFQQMVLEQLDINMQKKKNPLTLILYTKYNSKPNKYLKIKQNTVRLLKENIGEILYDLRLGKKFFGMIPKVYKPQKKKSINWPSSTFETLALSWLRT